MIVDASSQIGQVGNATDRSAPSTITRYPSSAVNTSSSLVVDASTDTASS